MMKINWKNDPPILFDNRAAWAGLDIRHLRVAPGELVEQTQSVHQLNLTLEGAITAQRHTAGGKWRTAQRVAPGCVCLTPASQPSKAVWQSELECLTISLTPHLIQQTALENDFSGEVEFMEVYARRDPLVQYLGLALLSEASKKDLIKQMYAESLAQTLTLHLLENYTVAGSLPASGGAVSGGLPGFKVRRAKEFMESHLEKDISLAAIAEVVNLSQFHFARAFRRSTGMTPQQYLVQQRINRAKKLLATGDLPLVEVAIGAGFKNQSHFTTLFRKFTALTPKAFREVKHR